MPITIDGNGTIGGASTLSTTVASPTFTTPNINSAQIATVTGTAPLYAARAWVNFNGTGTVAIRASGNVSSITDNGTGDYTVNFTNAMPDANYAVSLSSERITGNSSAIQLLNELVAPTTSAVRMVSTNSGDSARISVAIFR